MGDQMDHICCYWGATASKKLPAALSALLLCGTALSPTELFGQTLPEGFALQQGQAVVSRPAPQRMRIEQTTDRAVLNWDSFSIGAGSNVSVQQPNRNSALLNRVTGPLPSRIDGYFSANGQVFLVNPSGVVVGASGRVNTGSFVASTLDIRDDDFMSGQLRFEGDGGTVANHGQIALAQGGFAALLGGKVENTGTISVPLGRIGFGAGGQATLDIAGDQFLQIAFPLAQGDGPLIDNSGVLSADGGRIELTVAQAREAARNTINLSGVVEARTVSGRSGAITLGGGGGTVRVQGEISASAPARILAPAASPLPVGRPDRGGDVVVHGQHIFVEDAMIDVSGLDGGGTVKIGGDVQGTGDIPQANTTWIDERSNIRAEALHFGNGGTVIVWATGATGFAGQINARGGAQGGDGGFVEVSGKAALSMTGRVDLRAPGGNAGTLLLDPFDVTLSDRPTSGFGGVGPSNSAGAQPSNMNIGDLQAQLALGNVTVRTDTDGSPVGPEGFIRVENALSWASVNRLTLIADGRILIEAPITAPDGILDLRAGTEIQPNADGAINVGTLDLIAGDWVQVGSDVASFFADDFSLSSGATFLRASGGDGSADPYQIFDIYGLQGLGSSVDGGTTDYSASNYVLVNDIDGDGTTNWRFDNEFSFDGFRTLGDFSGEFDGDGYAINDMTIFNFGDIALFESLTSDGEIRDLTFNNLTVSGYNAAGLVLDNAGTITDVTVAGNIGGFGPGPVPVQVGGIAANNSGTISRSEFTGNIDVDESVVGSVTGGIAGLNSVGGLIDASQATVNTTATAEVVNDTILTSAHGGLVGSNVGTVSRSRAFGTIDASDGDFNLTDLGGLVGRNSGTIEQSAASTNVRGIGSLDLDAGGLVGENAGTIADSYATGSVTDAGNGGATIGGLVGSIFDGYSGPPIVIVNSFASGSVAGISDNLAVGGFSGSGGFDVSDSFWDTVSTGQASSPDGVGLTTTQLQDMDGFMALAPWDFEGVWAPPEAGFYPALYAIDQVIYALPDDATVDYGTATTTALTGSVFGGPDLFALGDLLGDTLDEDGIFVAPDLGRGDVGSYTIRAADPVVSDGGVSFRVVSGTGTLEVDPIALAIVADDREKTYGDDLALGSSAFSADGLVLGDTVTAVTLADPEGGAVALANVGEYVVSASDAVGDNLTNYIITYEDGALDVAPAPLILTADDRTKFLGDVLDLGTTGFSSSGLRNADAVDAVDLQSAGAPADATIDGSPYVITIDDAIGTGLENYDISYENGSLAVVPSDGSVLGVIEVRPAPLPNPPDQIVLTGNRSVTTPLVQTDLTEARVTRNRVAVLGTDFTVALEDCRQSDQQVGDYLACVAAALGQYAEDLEALEGELPPELSNVAGIVRDLRLNIDNLRTTAEIEISQNPARRAAITAQAIADARGAILSAQDRIRSQISLIRSVDPDLQAVQRDMGVLVVNTLETLDGELARAVEL